MPFSAHRCSYNRSAGRRSCVLPSLLTVEVIDTAGAQIDPLRRLNAPFSTVGIVKRFAHGIVGDDVDDEILGAVVEKLMRLSGSKEAGVAGNDRLRSLVVAHVSFTGNDVIELPLRAVRVEGIRRLSRRYAEDFDVERMTLVKVGGFGFASERLGDLDAFAGELSLGRRPTQRLDLAGIDLIHKVGRFAYSSGSSC